MIVCFKTSFLIPSNPNNSIVIRLKWLDYYIIKYLCIKKHLLITIFYSKLNSNSIKMKSFYFILSVIFFYLLSQTHGKGLKLLSLKWNKFKLIHKKEYPSTTEEQKRQAI